MEVRRENKRIRKYNDLKQSRGSWGTGGAAGMGQGVGGGNRIRV